MWLSLVAILRTTAASYVALVQLNNQETQAAHNIDTLLPLNWSNGPGNVLFAPHFVLSMQSRLVFFGACKRLLIIW